MYCYRVITGLLTLRISLAEFKEAIKEDDSPMSCTKFKAVKITPFKHLLFQPKDVYLRSPTCVPSLVG